MKRVVGFVHISLDGFVSSKEGDLSWVTINPEIFEYVDERIRKGNAALYGRVTYQMMEGYWPTAGSQAGASEHDVAHSRWYNSIQKFVLSSTLNESDLQNTTVISKNLKEEIEKAKQGEGDEILVFGSPTATHALMAENLLDEYWMLLNPIVLGEGVPFFKNIQATIKLTLKDIKVFDFGVVALQYARI